MKKIFAIALALVMVFAMASAFALSDCATVNFSWACPTDPINCGKASVEVVPYVHTNAACDGDEFVVSDCATAINDENVYYAIKLTVQANPMDAWFGLDEDHDTDFFVGFVTDGFTTETTYGDVTADEDAAKYEMAPTTGISMTATSEKVYYLVNDLSAWVEAKNAEFVAEEGGVIFKGVVLKAAAADVCAKIFSANDGAEVWTYGDFTVDASAAPEKLVFSKSETEVVTLETNEAGKITKIDASSDALFAEVVSTFKLNNCAVGTCINADNIKDNFGWEDEQEDCFPWSTKGQAVVDTECVVAIPKTGDVSVVAYAVMAVAAAAGMLKK